MPSEQHQEDIHSSPTAARICARFCAPSATARDSKKFPCLQQRHKFTAPKFGLNVRNNGSFFPVCSVTKNSLPFDHQPSPQQERPPALIASTGLLLFSALFAADSFHFFIRRARQKISLSPTTPKTAGPNNWLNVRSPRRLMNRLLRSRS